MNEGSSSPSPVSRQVTLHLPSEARLARLARTVIAAYGSLIGMGVEELDDVRLLVDEVFHTLLVVGAGPVTLRLTADRDLWLEMSAEVAAGRGWAPADDGMMTVIASVVADRFTFLEEAQRVVFRASISAR